MATKTAKKSSAVRKTVVAKKATATRSVKRRRPSWEVALERELIRRGYSPAEARELVELAAA